MTVSSDIFTISTTSGHFQDYLEVAALPNGGFVTAWTDFYYISGNQSDSRAQIMDAQGNKVGSEILVDTPIQYRSQGLPEVAALANNGFVIGWTKSGDNSNDYDRFRVQVFGANGSKAALFDVNVLSEPSNGGLYWGDLAVLKNGNIATTWYTARSPSSPYGDLSIMTRVVDVNGNVLTNEFELNSSDRATNLYPNIAALTGGGYVVVWQVSGAGHADASGFGIEARLFNASGQPVGNAIIPVNSSTDDDQRLATVAALPNGGFIVAWEDYAGARSDYIAQTIRAQMFDATGAKTGAELLISSSADASMSNVEVAVLSNGSYAMIWNENSLDSKGYGVKGQIYTAAGEKLGNAFTLGDEDRGSQFSSADIAALANGSFVATWTTHNFQTNGDDVVGTIIRPGAMLNGTARSDTIVGTDGNDTIRSGDGNDKVNGGRGDDVIYGGAGNDKLDGGAGADRMEGGLGNDTYYVDYAMQYSAGDPGDLIVEQSVIDPVTGKDLGGNDRVYSSARFFTLPDNVERLYLVGAEAVYGLGNGQANRIEGNEVANQIYGEGGNDTLLGMDGDDMIYGGDGNDKIDGGAGMDTMYGGAGNDTYIVDHQYDYAFEESAEGGTDTVQASVSYTLFSYVEKLVLTGNAAIDGTGNEGANTITGNDAANVLNGRAGKDVLKGGGGADIFVFDVLETSANRDTIKDFVSGEDHIRLAISAFTGLAAYGTGALQAGELAFGKAATAPGQHLIYNSANGALYYDVDGSGGAAQVEIVRLTGHPTLVAGDIVLV